MSFGVLTLNLWNINEPLEARYEALATGLKRLRPEIVCLQEAVDDLKSGQCQFEVVARMCGHAHIVHHGGLAIVCSNPVIRSSSVALPEFPGDQRRWALSAELLIEGRPVLVTDTHLASHETMIRERRTQSEIVLEAIKRQGSTEGPKAKILCGDFNDTADSPAVQTVLDGGEEFRDVFAACHPDSPGFTYVCRNRYVEPSWTVDERIDYIFASRDLVIKDCSIVFDGNNGFDLASDHFGVFCNLAFR
jgi:endonuclease/exonuclease/phosphatase family metal-dependent hydrolase